jgi:UTP--glucose-1-phosphate uridylyltransferase
MGAGISLFDRATAVKVPRSRLIPVKKCNDLLAVRSDYYVFSEDFKLILNPARMSDSIEIKLDPRYYEKIDLFDERFAAGVPSLLNCDAITIAGDVFFEEDVTLKKNVVIQNLKNRRAVIPKGSVIDGKVTL